MTKLINSCGNFFGFFLFSYFYQRLLAMALAFVVILGSGEMAMAQTTNQVTISGTFIVNWGDSRSGTGVESLTINDKAGKATVLNVDPKVLEAAGGSGNLNRKTVTITGKPAVITQVGTDPALRVDSIEIDSKNPENFQKQVVSGSKAFINILCRFPDKADQSVSKYNTSYFNGLMSANYPGMSHYWNEASYGLVNLNGTTAVGPFTLPQNQAYYVKADGNADLGKLFADCTSVADSSVYFPNYFGVNMAFNYNLELDGSLHYAWGGSWCMTRDGINRCWAATWEPPFGWTAQTIYAHEMGHSFGLRHSKFNGASSPYNNYWDVMSYTWDCSRATDPTYGCLGQQTNMDYKDILGWIPANQKFTYSGTAPKTITLEQSDLPVTGNYKMASIPYGSNGYFYTVEARRRVGYDTKLATNAVIIHEIEPARSPEPAWVQGTNGAAGAQLLPGQTFTDATNNIKVRVEAATASGFTITINPPPIPAMPANFVTSAASANQINLSWTDVAYEEVYKIERSPDNINWTQLATVGADVTTYADTNLPEGSTYYYRVWAYNISGNSTKAAVNTTTLLYAPGGLYALATSATNINLSWNDVSQINDSYTVERSTSQNGPFTLLNMVVANNYSDTTATSGTTYYYRVKATKAGPPLVESSYSQVAHATPGNVLVVSVGTDDGTGSTPNTLSAALNQATAGSIINFTVAQVNVTGTLPNVPAGVTISGSCASGPGVTIQGSGGTGLRFNTGSYSLFGLKIQGFGQPQIGPVLGASPKYTLKCVAINNQ